MAAYRRRQRARILLDKLEIISTLQKTDEKLHQCLEEEDYSGAIQLIVEAQNAAKTYCLYGNTVNIASRMESNGSREFYFYLTLIIIFSFFLWMGFTIVLELVSYFTDPEAYTLMFDLWNFLPLLSYSRHSFKN